MVRIEALADPTGESETPFRSAIARLRGDDVIEAYVFLANQNVGGEDYTVIVLSAEPTKDRDVSCRVEAETIVCNDVKRTPWRDPLPRVGAFKIPLGCRE